ncbi:TatD family hydrolase [Wenzhouxiangella sp. AB-CW3]|uniref:TatD family hydrolase n=1 Tax=Wenzhouxiangella sp. AB-CW3 TaxID=2771012 RepID=UPI00168BF636|nr:TatD family hydrolase [Wenzhouxiangella sp. AB-CW3]QOC22942.1 TatD family hydrolase [Wenzhouxiangella sp. AB-CW3]
MELIDIGCNLTHDSFGKDRDEVIAGARDVGVTRMVVTGASEAGSIEALKLARRHEGVLFATAGVHPHLAAEFTSETESVLADLHTEQPVVAVGECGLDYFRDFSPRPAQKKAFERQLELAVACGKPVFLHQRDAHADFLAILREFRPHLSHVVVHCFTDTREAMLDYLALDCHIGITGWICDERRGHHLKEFVDEIPADRLMIETDAPYLKPRNLRPKVRTHRNEPRWLPWIAGTVAACRGVTPQQLAAQTTACAREFFSLPA